MQVIKYEDLASYLASGKDFLIELGEQTGIGSSRLLVRKCGLTGLIDSGISFEGYGTVKVTTFPVGNYLEDIYLDYIIFTHGHADHIALILPVLKAHPESRVFFSKKTLELLKVILPDTLSVQRKAAKVAYFAGLPAPVPMFTEQDMTEFVAKAEDENGPYEVMDTDNDDVWTTFEDWPGWEFGFTFSGHMVGAFISAIKCPDGDGLVFSGDLSGHGQETTQGVKTISESFLEMAEFRKCKRIIWVTEATYGDRNRSETLEASDTRLKTVIEKTFQRGGIPLCPVFMLNRGPNIVKKLVRLGFKVFVAGGVRKTLPVEVGAELVEKWRADGTVMFIENGPNYSAMLDAAAKGEYGERIVVSSSATIDQGAIVDFAALMLPVSKNVLISTGHVFDGSAMQDFFKVKDQPVELGRTIVLNQMVNNHLTKMTVNVQCEGEHFDYSAHSDQSELITMMTGLKPDVVYVKHCIERGFNGLESALHEKMGKECPPISWARHLHLFEL